MRPRSALRFAGNWHRSAAAVWNALGVEIRAREHGDIAACLAIAERVHDQDGYPPRLPGDLRSFVVSPGALAAWVAVDGDEIVGQVVLNTTTSREVMRALRAIVGEAPIAVVARLLVAPERRRRGSGRELLQVALDEAWKLGRHPVLDVAVHFDAAISLYEGLGWVRVAEVGALIGDTAPLREYIYVGPDTAGTS